MYSFDHDLFLTLNFDGGSLLDRVMLTISATPMWIPLYMLILWLIWREYGWRNTLIFVLLMGAAVALADMVAGIFKHNGLLGDLLPQIEPRWRPMFTPSLEGLDIAPDSLRALRRAGDESIAWIVHVPREALAGKFGTVSAHASTTVALTLLSALAIGRRWYSVLIFVCALLICYSRIYLAKHFPMDIVWGALLGLMLGWLAYLIFSRFARTKR